MLGCIGATKRITVQRQQQMVRRVQSEAPADGVRPRCPTPAPLLTMSKRCGRGAVTGCPPGHCVYSQLGDPQTACHMPRARGMAQARHTHSHCRSHVTPSRCYDPMSRTTHACGCRTTHACSCRTTHARGCRTTHARGCRAMHARGCQTMHACSCRTTHARDCRTTHARGFGPRMRAAAGPGMRAADSPPKAAREDGVDARLLSSLFNAAAAPPPKPTSLPALTSQP